jgi:hypothetical protein
MIDVMYPGDSPLVLDLSIWVNRKYRTQVAEYLAEHRSPLVIRREGSESRSAVLEFKKPDGSAVDLEDVQAWWNPRHPENLMPAVPEGEEVVVSAQWCGLLSTLYAAEAVITGYTLESEVMTSGVSATVRVNRISIPVTSFNVLVHPDASSEH